MLRKALTGVALTAALTGCSGTGKYDNGVYFFAFPDFDAIEIECTETVTHNADAITCPEDDEEDDFTFTETWDSPPRTVIGEVIEAAYEGEEGFTHVLVLDNLFEDGDDVRLWGKKDGKTWTFEYSEHEAHDSSADHVSGNYSLTQNDTAHLEIVLQGEFDKGVFTGTLEYMFETDYTVTETDEWEAEDIGLFNPLLNQLVGEANLCEPGSTADDQDFFSYTSTDSECSSDPCSLQVVETCSSGSLPVTGRLTSDDGDGVVTNSDAGYFPT